MKSWVILPILILVSLPLRAQSAATNIVGARPGYTFDVEKEQNAHDSELVLIEPPPKEKTIHEKIFDDNLTKDIRDQYELRFGHTAIEQTMNAPQNRDDGYTYNGDPTVTAQQYQQYQLSFGQYVGRKVMETQADKFFKDSASMKAVYKYKDQFSNTTVKTTSGYGFNWHYNLSGNSLEMKIDNPYHIENSVLVQLGQEETFNVGYQVDPLWHVQGFYTVVDGVVQLVGSRKITNAISGTITGSTTTTPFGPSVRQKMLLVGISWTQ